jgi:hypothetical protein
MYCVIRDFQTLIVGIFAVFGVVATLYWNARVAQQQHLRSVAHDATTLRVALKAELNANRQAFRDRIETIRSPAQGPHMMVPLAMMSDVYAGQIGRLGLLSDREIDAVLHAYLLIRQVPERLKVLEIVGGSPGGDPDWVRIDRAHFGSLLKLHEGYLIKIEAAIAALNSS